MRADTSPEGAKTADGPAGEPGWAAAMRESEARFREAADSAPAPVWMTNTDGRVEFANLAFQEVAGLSEAQLLGDAWLTIVHPEDLQAVARKRAEAWAAGHAPYAFEARFRAPDGSWRWFEASCRPRRGADGEFHGYVGLAIDRTDARAAQEGLRKSEARYRAILESQHEPICRFRPDGEILFVNAAYARACHRPLAELRSANFWDLIAPDDVEQVRAMLGRLTLDNPEIQIENRFGPDEDRWYLWSNTALAFDDQGRLIEAQATAIDITDRKKAEEHRQMLLDELNHRVKNTLAVVQAMAHHVLKDSGVERQVKDAFEDRLTALARAHDLLTRTHWEQAAMADIAAGALIVCGSALDRIRIDGPEVLLEPRKALSMALALHELCTNAMKYGALSAAGNVTLTWQTVTGPKGAPHMHVEWRESGGPEVAKPTRRGYGSMLIERALARDLDGSAKLSFEPAGLVCEIVARV